jgi:hypothetical protein
MTSLPAPSSILPSGEWTDRVALRLPLVGAVSPEAISDFVSRTGFILLLAAVGMLLVHPGNFIPALEDAPIYQILISGCLLVSLPRVLKQMSVGALRGNGITAFALLLVAAAALSHLSRGNTYEARMSGAAVAKVSLLYLLVLGLVDSPTRLRATLAVVAASVFGMTVLAVLQYHGVVHLAGLGSVAQRVSDSSTEEAIVLVRLCGTGLFNDPNDLSLVLVISIIVCGYFLGDARLGRGRRLLLGPLALFGYALFLTHSRGGMVSALAGLLVFLCARIGGRNALALACLILPLLLVPAWGRQTNVDLADPEDTFQTRLELWSESLDALRSAPLIGIGQARLVDEIGQVAHNSYLHAYAEMGLIGGTAFLGAFYLVLRGLWRAAPADPELARMRPYVLALTGAYAAGLLSLSRCYHAPTQLVLALATAYLVLASRSGPTVLPRTDGPCVGRVAGVGLLFLAATYVFLRLMLQRGA